MRFFILYLDSFGCVLNDIMLSDDARVVRLITVIIMLIVSPCPLPSLLMFFRPVLVIGGSSDVDQESMGAFQEFPQVHTFM